LVGLMWALVEVWLVLCGHLLGFGRLVGLVWALVEVWLVGLVWALVEVWLFGWSCGGTC
jgi:hypothetical protein